MIGFFRNIFDSASKAEREAARESQRRQRAYEEDQRRQAEQERQHRIDSVRVLTGELKHRYVVIEALRGFGQYFVQPEGDYDPLEATRRAAYNLQEQAAHLGANAIIHARFEVLRYTQQAGPRLLPVYEVHSFGTAVRIVGPPADLDGVTHDDYFASESPAADQA